MIRLTLLIVLSTFVFGFAFAQSGSISGKVTDASSAEGLIGATVFLKSDSTVGTLTDIDGYYTLENLAAGSYNIVIRYVSYQSKEIDGVTFIAVTKEPPLKTNVIHWMKKDNMEYVK